MPRRAAIVTLGLAGLVFGGLPYWAARKVLYPPVPEPLPHGLDEALTIEPDISAEPVKFVGRDGNPISGWFVPGAPGVEQSPCILLVYGYGGYKEQMVGYASLLRDAGFASLMFDMQGSGLLSGRPVTLGYRERWDLMDAAAYARSRPDVDPTRIGALGVSMGAATALLAAELDPGMRAIVADSSYASLPDMVTPGLRAFVGRAAIWFAPLIVWFGETMVGFRSRDIAPERSAARMGHRHLLVIHGDQDDLTHPDSAMRIFEAASGPKELWVVPECGHSAGPAVSPEEYKQRVNDFFRRALDWPAGALASQVA
ncbi:MAG TPA: alpha/beta fold hydrolase [Chloroflexia bacterium]|nr:alpha/beta fold hydrolase [Chloroflexia bacterium]